MKQVIILVTMIGLGLAISGFIHGFEETAGTMTTTTQNNIQSSMNSVI